MSEEIILNINGEERKFEMSGSTPLLYVLRNQLNLTGTKFGCGLGQCGACMVLVDDKATYSCLVPVRRMQGRTITTIEGLVDTEGNLHPVQTAFLQEQAAQCGYCTSGMIISGVSLLNANSNPDREQICSAFQGNLCRCGVQHRVIKAMEGINKNQ